MVSVDEPAENRRFVLEHQAEFTILSDPSKEMATSYGVLHPRGFANRWTFYIDKEGILQKIDQKVKPVTAGADMVTAMGELNFTRND